MIELPVHIIDEVLERAFEEDIPYADITTDFLGIGSLPARGFIKANEKLVVAGIEVARRAFEKVDPLTGFNALKKDGELVEGGEVIAVLSGRAGSLLKGERIALNILTHLSGIATSVRNLTELLRGTEIRVADTRKTLPGLRALQKYAVCMGGGYNHRFSLSDAVMIKSNHINIYGSIKMAVREVKRKAGPLVKVEVEVRNMEELKEAVESGADVIMLDNMSLEEIKEAVKRIKGRAKVEISGGITPEKIKRLKNLKGIDYISMGSITHSVRAVDIRFEILRDEG